MANNCNHKRCNCGNTPAHCIRGCHLDLISPTAHWKPIAPHGGPGNIQGYVTDEAVIMHDIRNLVVDVRNVLIDILRAIENG